MRHLRFATYLLCFYLAILSWPAQAKDALQVAIHHWPTVYDGMGQSYNVQLSGNAYGTYIILSLHPDTAVFGVNHSAGIECHEYAGTGTTVMCYAEQITSTITVGVHGTIKGPGDKGTYGVLRVGTLDEGSPGRGWLLAADYVNGTIPSAIGPTPEQVRSTQYLPFINGGTFEDNTD